MAINKKLIHFKTKQKFNEELANGNILETSIVFILDTKQIYTHGQLYDGSTFDPTDIEASILNIIDNYATKTEMPTKVSQLENDANYILDNVIPDGVYAVDANGKLIDYNTADASALGVALVAGEHKFMIAKSDATDGTNTTLYWGKNLYKKDVAGITNISSGADFIGEGEKYGTDFTTWSTGPVVDFNGAANTAAIIAGYTEHGVSMDARDMCTVLNTFNASDGYNDWYIPACGQLALMYLAKTDINAALANIGGTAFNESSDYWPSSEYDASRAWYVDFDSGYVDDAGFKDNGYRVRFIRDITVKSLKERVSELESKVNCIKFTNKTANAWIEDPTYSNFKYKCDIACEGVTTDMYAEVVFNVDQAVSGNYSPVCETGNGIVTIWSSVTDSITIPTIIITE